MNNEPYLTLVAEFPAYRVFRRRAKAGPHFNLGVVDIRAGELLALNSNRGYYKMFRANSVAAYAIEYNDDPIAAVERAKAHGHELHWLTPMATVISNPPPAQVDAILIEVGMLIWLQGKVFRIAPGNNSDNLKLIEELV